MARTDRQARRHFFTTLAALPLLAALALAPEVARAQWTTTGNTVHPTDPAKTVGVGATAATNKLEVVDASANTGTFADIGSFPLALENSDQTNNNTVGINFRSRASNGVLYGIGGIALRSTSHLSSAYNSDIEFYNRNNNTVSTPFIIKSNGNVGIGTSAPTSQLGVVDTSNNGVAARFVQSNASASNGLFIQTQTASAGDLALHVSSNAGATVGLVVRNTGNVGVGTTSPVGRLDVRQVSNAGTLATILTSSGASEDTFVRGGSSSAAVHIGDLTSSTSKLLLMENGGNVGIGTTTPTERLHVVGNIKVTGNIEAKFQDVAEWVPSRQRLAAGTVVVLDTTANNHVVASSTAYDTGVAGVVSAQPGLILGEGGEGKVMVATTGRVKVRVDATRAPVGIGDLLVTSDVSGVAMKSEPVKVGGRKLHAPGTIVGKALEPLEKGVGEILVLLSLQ